jgi:ABC-type nitrate/sulfonate/bicarbonate transport system permease component
VNLFSDTLAWIAEHFANGELWVRVGEQVFYTVISVLIASAIAIPVG